MKRLETTPRFYLERVRSQIIQARGRQYPDAGDIPAKWLSYIENLLNSSQQLLDQDRLTDLEAELAHVTIAECYGDLEYAEKADTSQVSYPVVQALRRWFDVADPQCGYLFTSGTEFEILQLIDVTKDQGKREAAVKAGINQTVYAITMPGGALGSAFHIPLVAHEVGHVLANRLGERLFKSLIKCLTKKERAAFKGPEAEKILQHWTTEVFADSVCGFITGPAGFFALHEKLRGNNGFDDRYPPNHMRVLTLAKFVRKKFGKTLKDFGITETDWQLWPVGDPSIYKNQVSRDELIGLAESFLPAMDAIRDESIAIAKASISSLEYKHKQLSKDLGDFLKDFYHAIPPFETKGEVIEPTGLTTILNVGWFVAAFRTQEMRIKVPGNIGKMLVRLDHLINKAIELSEIRRDWERAS